MKSYTLGELCTDIDRSQIKTWLVKPGDHVNAGDALLELECTKVNLQVLAPISSIVTSLLSHEGDYINSDSNLIELKSS